MTHSDILTGDAIPQPPEPLRKLAYRGPESHTGFKAVETASGWEWQMGTEEEYRAAVAKVQGVAPDEVQPQRRCYAPDPFSCRGTCLIGFCTRYYDAASTLYFCDCLG